MQLLSQMFIKVLQILGNAGESIRCKIFSFFFCLPKDSFSLESCVKSSSRKHCVHHVFLEAFSAFRLVLPAGAEHATLTLYHGSDEKSWLLVQFSVLSELKSHLG